MEPQFNWAKFKNYASYKRFPGTFPYGLSRTALFVLLLRISLPCNGDGELYGALNTGLQVFP